LIKLYCILESVIFLLYFFDDLFIKDLQRAKSSISKCTFTKLLIRIYCNWQGVLFRMSFWTGTIMCLRLPAGTDSWRALNIVIGQGTKITFDGERAPTQCFSTKFSQSHSKTKFILFSGLNQTVNLKICSHAIYFKEYMYCNKLLCCISYEIVFLLCSFSAILQMYSQIFNSRLFKDFIVTIRHNVLMYLIP
jgi:hypothetical protein